MFLIKNLWRTLARYLLILLAVIGLLAAAVFLYATSKGIGLGFDSVVYISAARSLADGIGLGRLTCTGFKPMTLWQPLYPIILAGISLIGIDAILAARIVSAMGIGFTSLLTGLLVYQVRREALFSLFAAVLILLSSPILNGFSWAMSEAVYIPLFIGAILLMGKYIEARRPVFLFIGSFLIGLALITRYVGIVIIAIIGLLLLLNPKTGLRDKAYDLVVLAGLGFLPMFAWSIRNRLAAGSATGRILAFHPRSLDELDFMVKQVNSWFLLDRWLPPFYGRYMLVVLSFLAVVILTGYLLIKWIKDQKAGSSPSPDSFPLLLLLHTAVYPITILGTIFFVTPSVSITDERVLIPLLIGLLALAAIAAAYAWRTNHWFMRILVIALMSYLLVMSAVRQVYAVKALHANGQGFASDYWQNAASGKILKNLPTTMIYTNDYQAVYFISEKPACVMPLAEKDLEPMRANVRQENGIVIVFGNHIPEFLPIEEITHGMIVIEQLPEATIYRYPVE